MPLVCPATTSFITAPAKQQQQQQISQSAWQRHAALFCVLLATCVLLACCCKAPAACERGLLGSIADAITVNAIRAASCRHVGSAHQAQVKSFPKVNKLFKQSPKAATLFIRLTCVDWAGGARCGHIHHTVLDVDNLCTSHTHLLLTHKASLNHVLHTGAAVATAVAEESQQLPNGSTGRLCDVFMPKGPDDSAAWTNCNIYMIFMPKAARSQLDL
jgi:hypothetical protein